jgi:hypothetical protein
MEYSMRLALVMAMMVACSGAPPAEPKKEEKKEDTGCGLSPTTLAGKDFVRVEKGADGKTDEFKYRTRARFYTEGDKLKMKYSANEALTDVYTYTCSERDKGITCWEDNPRAEDFCKALFANKGACTAEEIQQFTGLKPEVAKAAADKVNGELAKLPPDIIANVKKEYNNPNSQLRAVAHVSIKKQGCGIFVKDMFQSMSNGQLNEMETKVGTASLAPHDKEMLFEHCKESKPLVALKDAASWAQPGETVGEWAAGAQIPFRYVGEVELKPAATCTYTQDIWADHLPLSKGAAVTTDAEGRLSWSFTHSFADKSIHVVAATRYKACDGKPAEMIDTVCQAVKIQ